MCFILLALKQHADFPFILAANRDEFFQRPTAPAEFWPEHPEILAGRDLQAQGTWLGITRGGRLAALTNFRNPESIRESAPSRGRLVMDYLQNGSLSPADYLKEVEAAKDRYNGFNLLAGTSDQLHYCSNQQQKPATISRGIHGLSNHLLDTDWPKIQWGKQRLKRLLSESQSDAKELADQLLALLGDRRRAPDADLPRTGISLEFERMLSSVFIEGEDYGTRCSTIILSTRDGEFFFVERSFDDSGHAVGDRQYRW